MFPNINHKLKNELQAILEVLVTKNEAAFDELEITWSKNQASENEIGQIVKVFKTRKGLESVRLVVGNGNNVE